MTTVLQRILSFLPKTRQTLLFSATFSPEIKRLAQSYLQDPILVETARPNQTASTVEQRFISATDDDKRAIIKQILKERSIRQAIVFGNSKLGVARLARSFERDGLRTAALHGDKSQDERLKSLDAFKRGEVDLLVATDVAARGLDIADLPAVFNFDVPFNAEDYVHRIGRTGRAGASGLAVTLVTKSDARLVADIEKLIKRKIDLDAFELDGGGDRPRGERRRPDERAERGAERAGERDQSPRPPRPAMRPPAPPADPFFDKPYEASERDDAPAWEKARAAAPTKGLSSYIKPKKQVAALFGAKRAPAPTES